MRATYDFTVRLYKVYGAWVTSFNPPISWQTPDDLAVAIMDGQRVARERIGRGS
jgi:hypothetical protein